MHSLNTKQKVTK